MEPLLSIGDTGEWVSHLQGRLIELGLDPGPADGTFGNRTQDAVSGFQYQNGLEADGVVGPATWGAIDAQVARNTAELAIVETPPELETPPESSASPVLWQGHSGEWVSYLQQLLAAVGHPSGAIDGVFGGRTDAAVRGYQGGQRLVGDGVVGPTTWAALMGASGPVGTGGGGTDTGTGSPLDDYFDDYGGGTGGTSGFGDKDDPKKASQPPKVEDDLKESWCIPHRHIKSVDRAVIGQVFFSTNSDFLDADDTNALNNLVKALSELESSFPGVDPVRIVFRGHADPRGTDQANLDLSSRRAVQAQGYVVRSLPPGDPRFETDTHAMGESPEALPDVPTLFAGHAYERRVDIFSVGAPIVKSVAKPTSVESQRQRIVRILKGNKLESEPTRRLLCVFDPDIKKFDQYLHPMDPDVQKVMVPGQPRMSDAEVGALLQRHSVRNEIMTDVYSPSFSDSDIASALAGLDIEILAGIQLVDRAESRLGELNVSRPFTTQMRDLIADSQRNSDSLYSCYR